MTSDEAKSLVAWLGGMIPTMTDQQSRAIEKALESLEFKPAHAALKRYAETYSRIDVAALLAIVRPARRGPDPLIVQSRRDHAAYESERQQIDGFFARVDEVELCRARAAVLADAEPYVQIQLAGADPRNSPILRSLIYQHMTGSQSLQRSAS